MTDKVFILIGWAREEFETTFGVFSNKPSAEAVSKLIGRFVGDHALDPEMTALSVAQFAVDNIGKSSVVQDDWAGIIIEEHEVINNG